MDEEFANWFAREILVHEAALTRFIAHTWIARNDVQDIRQEIYIKVLEAAERQRPASPRSYLFTTAKNLLIDRARRHRIVPIDLSQDVDALNVLIDSITPEHAMGSLQQLVRLSQAFERLPDRCREVVWLRKIEDIPQREIAARLNISEGTVEGHLTRGVRMLTQLFYADTETSNDESERDRKGMEHETHHGK